MATNLKKDMDEYNEVVYQAQNIDKPGVGEGIAMGLMGLGDALGGAWDGKTDFLGGFLKAKKEREKIARGKKLSPYEYMKLKASNRDKKRKEGLAQEKDARTRKSSLLGKLNQMETRRETTNTKILDINKGLPPNRQINLVGISPTYSRLVEEYEKEFGPLRETKTKGPKEAPKPKQILKPVKPIKPTSDLKDFSEKDKELVEKLGFTGNKQDIKNSLNHYRALEKIHGVDVHNMDIPNFSQLSYNDKKKHKSKTAQLWTSVRQSERKDKARYAAKAKDVVGKKLDPLNIWEKQRKNINASLFEFLTDKTGSKVLTDFSLNDLYTVGDKVFYKKEFVKPGGAVEEINMEIEIPVLGGTELFGESRRLARMKEPGFSKFDATIQSILNQELNKLSGAAVSEQEYARFIKAWGKGTYTQNPAELIRGLKKLERAYQIDLNDVNTHFLNYFPGEERALKYWNEGFGKLVDKKRKSSSRSNPELFLKDLLNYKIPDFTAKDLDGKERRYHIKKNLRFHRAKKRSPKEILEYYDSMVIKNIMNAKQKPPVKKEEKSFWNFF